MKITNGFGKFGVMVAAPQACSGFSTSNSSAGESLKLVLK